MRLEFPEEFTSDRSKLSLAEARSIVGRWLAFTRSLSPEERAWAIAHRPAILKKAYVLSNLQRDIPDETRKSMTKTGNSVPHVTRSLAFRLRPLLDAPLPGGAKVILNEVKPLNRPAFDTAFLEIPYSEYPDFVTRFKASYSRAYCCIVCTVRGHGKRPVTAPKTHPWRVIPPQVIATLPEIAQTFIRLTQATRSDRARLSS